MCAPPLFWCILHLNRDSTTERRGGGGWGRGGGEGGGERVGIVNVILFWLCLSHLYLVGYAMS